MKRLVLGLGLLVATGLVVGLILSGIGGRGATPGSAPSVEARVSAPVTLAGSPPESEPESERSVSERSESAPARERGAAPDSPTEAVDGASAAAARVLVRGRVLDRSGEGLPGVDLVQSKGGFNLNLGGGRGKTVATSGAGGAFDVELSLGPNGAVLECARDSGFATLRAGLIGFGPADEVIVVAAPEIELAGTVADPGGVPLDGATLSFEVPLTALAGFPAILDGTQGPVRDTVSGGGGRFRLRHVPAAPGGRLAVRREGYRTLDSEAPLATRTDLLLTLEPLAEAEPWLIGVVLRADGTPAQGAVIQLDTLATRTDAEGRFELQQGPANAEAPLVAALPGLQPAIVPGAGALMAAEFPPPAVRLVLGGPSLSIAGRILDSAGRPGRGWQVTLHDGTVVTPSRWPSDLAEGLARAGRGKVKSDRDGAFVLEGLLARDYVVQVFDPESLLVVRSSPVPAGTSELVLCVPADAFLPRVAGRVVTRDGTPLAGAQVKSRIVTSSARHGSTWRDGRSVTSDAEGGFELADVPRRFSSVEVTGQDLIRAVFELEGEADPERLILSVTRRLHFRVEPAPGLASAAEPESISVLDAEDRPLALHSFHGNSWSTTQRLELVGGATHTLGVSEEARTLVFLRGRSELRRLALVLVPGEVTVVRGE